MYPSGSGYPPTIDSFSNTCDAATGTSVLAFSINKAIAGSTCHLTITEDNTQVVVFSDSFRTVNIKTYSLPSAAGVSALANGTYTLEADNGENNAQVGFEVNCAAATCDLVVTSVTPTPPTSPSGFGYVTITYTTTAAQVFFGIGGTVSQYQGFVGNNGVLTALNLPAGNYSYSVGRVDDRTCTATGDFTIAAATPPVDPSLGNAPRWEPVGGVLPNPVLLAVEATLTDTTGVPRAGLHVEVKLWRPAAQAAFASFRATVRQAAQQVDAAPYLRAQLVAAQRYPATASSPLVDADAVLSFTYRFRVVDSTGPESWQTRAGARYAVLAALPAAADTMQPYVADTGGTVASVFPSGEAVQFVGSPLEVSVLLPPPTAGQNRWAELRYLDANQQEVEIRSYALASTLPAGYLRIPLPGDPLPCAAFVEASVRDDNRAYPGTCSGAATTPPIIPPTTPPATSKGYLLTNTGRLKL